MSYHFMMTRSVQLDQNALQYVVVKMRSYSFRNTAYCRSAGKQEIPC